MIAACKFSWAWRDKKSNLRPTKNKEAKNEQELRSKPFQSSRQTQQPQAVLERLQSYKVVTKEANGRENIIFSMLSKSGSGKSTALNKTHKECSFNVHVISVNVPFHCCVQWVS